MRSASFDDLFQKSQRRRLRYLIVTLNVLCLTYTLANIVMCANSEELIDYFDSQDFIAYMLVTVVRNAIAGVCLLVYGSHIFTRLRSYSSDTCVVRTSSSATLLRACNKLILLVVVSNVAFILQLVAVVVWIKYDSSNSYYMQTPDRVHMSHFAYWLLLECLPKAVPSLTFFVTMGFLNQVWDRSRHKSSGQDNVSGRVTGSNCVGVGVCVGVGGRPVVDVYDESDEEGKSSSSTDSRSSSVILKSPLLSNAHAYYANEDDEVFYNSMRSSLEEVTRSNK